MARFEALRCSFFLALIVTCGLSNAVSNAIYRTDCPKETNGFFRVKVRLTE